MIVNLSEEILSAEASGVLNWMLEGLAKLKADDWVLRLTAKQTKTVDDLLLQSDSSNVFVRECLESDEGGGTITSLDLFEAYSRYCRGRDWTALPRHKAGGKLAHAIAEMFGLAERNDILDTTGKNQRGWKGIRCRS